MDDYQIEQMQYQHDDYIERHLAPRKEKGMPDKKWQLFSLSDGLVIKQGTLEEVQDARRVLDLVIGPADTYKRVAVRPVEPPAEKCSMCARDAVAKVAYPSYQNPIGRCLYHMPEIHPIAPHTYMLPIHRKVFGDHLPTYE